MKKNQNINRDMITVEKTIQIRMEQVCSLQQRQNHVPGQSGSSNPPGPEKTILPQQNRTAKIAPLPPPEKNPKSHPKTGNSLRLWDWIRKILNYHFFESHTSVDTKITPAVSEKISPIVQNPAWQGKLQDINSAGIRLHDVIAEGGQGILVSGEDLSLNRTIAVKSLRKELQDDPALRQRFITEAQVTAQLNHPSIVPIYSLVTDGENGLHLSMKKLQGITLQEYLEQVSRCYSMDGIHAYDEHKSIRYRLDMFLRVCDAIAYAHSRNILHCDLKPENIMIGEYHEAYVMDWGIAHPIRNAEYHPDTWTRPRMISGTPRFLAPEVILGDLPDERADVFALGLILFETVTLQPGFSGKDNNTIMEKILDGNMTPVKHLYHTRIDTDLKAIIHKACATNRQYRYQSAAELASDIRRYLSGNETKANPDNLYLKIARFSWQHRKAVSQIV